MLGVFKKTLEAFCEFEGCQTERVWEFVGRYEIQGQMVGMYECKRCGSYASKATLKRMQKEYKKSRE